MEYEKGFNNDEVVQNILNIFRTNYTIEQAQRYGTILKSHYDILRTFTDVSLEVERNLTYQVKPGDSLLPQDKWNNFVLFQNELEERTRQIKFHCQNKSEVCLSGKSDYFNQLNTKRDVKTLKDIWESWHNVYNDTKRYNDQLEYIKQATLLNGFETVKDYWEALVDFPGGYEQADTFWHEISPFYEKLQSFIKNRIFQYYHLGNVTEKIPVYLLGGNFGTDWSLIADVVLPEPQLHYDVELYLKYKSSKEVYKYSENMVQNLGFSSLGDKFWTNSRFNSSICGPELFEFCNQGYTEVIDCNKTSWSSYLNAQETALKIALNNLDYTSLPRYNLRYCAIDDAMEKLGSILAIEGLKSHGITTTTNPENETTQMTKLLLTALRVMPKLAYSFMADKWRMEILEQNITNIAGSWWSFRGKYTGVQGVSNKEKEYLDDPKIVSNRPYISEFFGTLIAFQLHYYYKDRVEESHLIEKAIQEDETFITLLRKRHTTDWPYLLSIHYGLDLSTTELLEYFKPLETYFQTAPSEQVPIVTTPTTTELPENISSTLGPLIKMEVNLQPDIIVNDQPKLNTSTLNVGADTVKTANMGDSHETMYLGLGILIIVACLLLVAFGYTRLRRKRRTNNRR
ncbi:hypothetical protein ABEB36_005653 [Hypothenemus hampei]|uniref:Angiotensin-converting enzyme n=1 Tax=Hypothenemus hampei TaxID=57062 RepID=A0ABD1EYZ6_HYPHA